MTHHPVPAVPLAALAVIAGYGLVNVARLMTIAPLEPLPDRRSADR